MPVCGGRGDTIDRVTDRRWLALGLALVVSLVAVLGAIGWPASAYQDGDFTQFWVQPRALIEGGDPYDRVWWSSAHERAGQRPENPQAVYPPHDAIAFLPLALLPLPYAAAAWIVAQLVAVAIAIALLSSRILPRAGRSLFVAVCLSFQPLWLLAVGANVTGFLFAAVAGAVIAIADRRPFRAGVCMGLLIVKPHPVVFLVAALLVAATWPQRRGLALGALSSAGPLAVAALALRPGWYVEWLGSAVALASSPRSNATVWTLDRVTGLPAGSGLAAAVLVTAAFVVWFVRVRPPLALAFAAAIPVSLAVAPYGWSYDQLLLLVPIAFALAATSRLAARGIVALVATVVPWSLYVLAFRRGGEELSVITSVLVFLMLVLPACRRTGDDPRNPVV